MMKGMKRRAAVTGAALLLLAWMTVTSRVGAAEAIVLHVAPDGRDSWTGRTARPAPDGSDGPLATLAGARDRIRALRSRGAATGPVTVRIADGTYRLGETLRFGPEDSGAKDAPVIYEAAQGAKPVISGGRVITGWKLSGKLWRATVPGAAGGKWVFRQLFVDGRRCVRARHPNLDDYWFTSKTELSVENGVGGFVAAPGEVRQWRGWEDMEIVLYRLWDLSRYRPAGIDEAAGKVTYHVPPGETRVSHRGLDKRYHFENLPAFLDAEGEWYLDGKKGLVLLRPFAGQNPSRAEVVAPVVRHLVRIKGAKGKPVSHLVFRGLTFRHADWAIPKEGYHGHQADVVIGAAVEADYVESCAFEGCLFEQVGAYALWLRKGARGNVVSGCEFRDLGAGGPMIGEIVDPVATERKEDETRGNTISDCRVRDNGRVFPSAVGLFVGFASGNRIANNHVHHTTYTGISVGWGWADKPSGGHHNIIEGNHVHDAMQIMGDGGCIYTLGRQPGTVIRNNVCHDTQGFYTFGAGIYLDGNTAEVTVENNLVARTIGAAFVNNVGGRNVIRNNIFALPGTGVFHLNRCKGNRIEGNVVFTRGEALFNEAWTPEHSTSKRNLYFIDTEVKDVFPGGKSFDEWRLGGQDEGGVLTDPGFADPESGDFSLRPDTPAAKIGFKVFPVPNIGPPREDRTESLKMIKLFNLARLGYRPKFVTPNVVGRPDVPGAKEKGLVAWWPFDRSVPYRSRGATDGKLMLGARLAKGRVGNGVELDGDMACVRVAYNPVFDTGDTLTLAAWVRIARTQPKGMTGVLYRQGAWRLCVREGTPPYTLVFEPYLQSKKYRAVVSKEKIRPDEWTHAVVTFDLKDGAIALYINGKLSRKKDLGPADALRKVKRELGVGVRDSRIAYLRGVVDEVRVYSRALSPDEVKALYDRDVKVGLTIR